MHHYRYELAPPDASGVVPGARWGIRSPPRAPLCRPVSLVSEVQTTRAMPDLAGGSN